VYSTKNNSRVAVAFVRREDDRDLPPEHAILDSINRMFGINQAWHDHLSRAGITGPARQDLESQLERMAHVLGDCAGDDERARRMVQRMIENTGKEDRDGRAD
jgi:hypothetical protein